MRILWTAAELGLEYEHIPVAHGDPALKAADFLKISPAGAIPAVVEGDFALSKPKDLVPRMSSSGTPSKRNLVARSRYLGVGCTFCITAPTAEPTRRASRHSRAPSGTRSP